MTAADISGLCILLAATVIAASELLLTAWVWTLPPIDPCRERPSSLPPLREPTDAFAIDYARFER